MDWHHDLHTAQNDGAFTRMGSASAPDRQQRARSPSAPKSHVRLDQRLSGRASSASLKESPSGPLGQGDGLAPEPYLLRKTMDSDVILFVLNDYGELRSLRGRPNRGHPTDGDDLPAAVSSRVLSSEKRRELRFSRRIKRGLSSVVLPYHATRLLLNPGPRARLGPTGWIIHWI
jgi:hypothetical protein